MIISVEDLKKRIDCGTATDDQIAVKLDAIEAVIRAYTNNNFQHRGIRFLGYIQDGCVYGSPTNFAVGDTVEVSDDLGVNDGLFVIKANNGDSLEFDKPLATAECVLVTKVTYPADVVMCAVDLFKWNQNMGEKVGIKSETISRHSVTYEDSATLFMGYPVGILNGLKLHRKARC